MTKTNQIQLFNDRKVRTVWDSDSEEWYFSVVDVVGVLTDSADPSAYWCKLKQRLKNEGNETVTNCHRLKLLAADGKMRLTDVATTQQMFRLIQSSPSPPLRLSLSNSGWHRWRPRALTRCRTRSTPSNRRFLA